MVVIAIIGLLSSIVLASLSEARKKARDAKRLADAAQIINALELYNSTYNTYPGNTDNDCGGWDTGNTTAGDVFITPLQTSNSISKVPMDSIGSGTCSGYRYYRYSAGSNGCNINNGAFFVLGISDMETSAGIYPTSPGWSCSGRNWQSEFDWVVGKFEK